MYEKDWHPEYIKNSYNFTKKKNEFFAVFVFVFLFCKDQIILRELHKKTPECWRSTFKGGINHQWNAI